MARGDEGNWLDDAFDDKKAAEEMDRLQRSQRTGCIVWAIVLIIAFVVFLAMLGAFGFLTATS